MPRIARPVFAGVSHHITQDRKADTRRGDPPDGESFGGTTFGVPPYES